MKCLRSCGSLPWIHWLEALFNYLSTPMISLNSLPKLTGARERERERDGGWREGKVPCPTSFFGKKKHNSPTCFLRFLPFRMETKKRTLPTPPTKKTPKQNETGGGRTCYCGRNLFSFPPSSSPTSFSPSASPFKLALFVIITLNKWKIRLSLATQNTRLSA